VAALDRLTDLLAYYPSRGKLHVVKVDEADQMTDKAQFQVLSKLDSTGWLKPVFGGGFERGPAPQVIWIFTCYGRGENGTTPPSTFEPHLLSRCLVVACEKPEVAEIAQFLRRIWSLEGGDASADPSSPCRGLRRREGCPNEAGSGPLHGYPAVTVGTEQGPGTENKLPGESPLPAPRPSRP
jgi:hypothetical protein